MTFIFGIVIISIGSIGLIYTGFNCMRSYVAYKAMTKYPENFSKGCLEALEEEDSSLSVEYVFNETRRLLEKYLIGVIVSLIIILLGLLILIK